MNCSECVCLVVLFYFCINTQGHIGKIILSCHGLPTVQFIKNRRRWKVDLAPLSIEKGKNAAKRSYSVAVVIGEIVPMEKLQIGLP